LVLSNCGFHNEGETLPQATVGNPVGCENPAFSKVPIAKRQNNDATHVRHIGTAMDDLDFSHLAAPCAAPATAPPASLTSTQFPNKSLPTDPQLAARFFATAGDEETLEAGSSSIVEGEKPDSGLFSRKARMYLLREGQVALTLKGRPLHLVLPGECFGELAIISDAPRSATATALRASRLVSMDDKRVLQALPQTPEIALQLATSLSSQMRRCVERLLTARRAIQPRVGCTDIHSRPGACGRSLIIALPLPLPCP
jgi:CRP-like cAMP-binding protein